MKRLLPSDIESLLEERPGPCLSFYFPTSRPGIRTEQGTIRLKNLLRRAEADLRLRGLDAPAIEELLEPLEDLLADPSFWATQEEGVALFRAPGFTQVFHLPRPFPDRFVLADHFSIKGLLPLIAGDDVFYILALSQNQVRLLEARGRSLRRCELEDLPGSLTEALGDQLTPQYLSYHTASSAPAGALPAVYHGRGVGEGDRKEELRRFLRQVETGMRGLLASRTAPLVLAGAEPLPSIYREISGYRHLAETDILGNPERLADEELRDRAWKLVEPTFQANRRRAAERFGELAGTGQASNDPTKILAAALHGRVEALFLDCEVDLWGKVDSTEKVVVHAEPEDGDEDLLDAAAQLSLRHGGMVYGLGREEIPGGGGLAAVFRY